jgi:hypothetical protein
VLGSDTEFIFRPIGYFATMGADFSKFQEVLRSALQILPADNLKGFKTQPTIKNKHQEHKERTEWNYSVFSRLYRS